MTPLERNIINLNFIKAKDFDGLIAANRKYVFTIAKSITKDNDYNLQDLIQVGTIGLYEAALAFNPEVAPMFILFARMYVKGAMMDYLTEHSRTVRLPANIVISDRKNNTSTSTTVSWNQPHNIDEGGEDKIYSIPSNDVEVTDYKLLYHHMSKLTESEQELIKLRFGFDSYDKHTLLQLSKRYNATKETMRNRINKVLKKLNNEETRRLL